MKATHSGMTQEPEPGAAAELRPAVSGFQDTIAGPRYNEQSGRSALSVISRGQWSRKSEFILSSIGNSVGLGNLWRFPSLAYSNGGAAFLIAYLILQLIVGKPLYFLELGVGQFSGRAPTGIWEMNPAAKGVGMSMCLICLIISTYYNVIMAYCLHFVFASMKSELPWLKCKDEWISEYNCVSKLNFLTIPCTSDVDAMNKAGICTCTGNVSIDGNLPFACEPKASHATSAAELYFYKSVIQRSVGLESENIGTPLVSLLIYLALSWAIVVLCLIRGIKSSGKVVYFTATFPYFIIILLLARLLFLDGAADGIKFFFIPEWERLADVGLWAKAAGQMFFSLGITIGGCITYASYNKFTNNAHSDAMFIATVDLVTSILGGLVVFTTFGAMAKKIGTTVDRVAQSGYGLVFVVYPEALTYVYPAQLWSVLFFIMLYTLGLDSLFAMIETVLTCLKDEIPRLRGYKASLCILVGISCCIAGLPCICPGGDYVVTIMDHYGADFTLISVSFFETISVMWVYGARRFSEDMKYMLGYQPLGWAYWLFCLTVCCPCILFSLLVQRMVQYKAPKYPSGKPFPVLAQSLGWALSAFTVSPIFLWFFYKLIRSFLEPGIKDNKQRVAFLFSPTHRWKPNDWRNGSSSFSVAATQPLEA